NRPVKDLKITDESDYSGTLVLNTKTRRTFQGENELLGVCLEYAIGDLKVRRIWELHPGLASVRNYYLFMGKSGTNWLQYQARDNAQQLIEDVSLLGDSQAV